MRSLSDDTNAMTNPALTSLLLWQFVTSFEKKDQTGPAFSIMFLVLPIVMSRSVIATLKGTNVNTGLLSWLTRNQQLIVTLAEDVRGTKPLSKEALRFGMAHKLFSVDEVGNLHGNPLPRKLSFTEDDERKGMFSAAGRLGNWCSNVTPTTMFQSFGIVPL